MPKIEQANNENQNAVDEILDGVKDLNPDAYIKLCGEIPGLEDFIKNVSMEKLTNASAT
jgi:hemerythrin superfamily protein